MRSGFIMVPVVTIVTMVPMAPVRRRVRALVWGSFLACWNTIVFRSLYPLYMLMGTVSD